MALIFFGCVSGVLAWSAWSKENKASFGVGIDAGDGGGGDGGGGGGD
jgi:hypothetical protein